MMVLESRYVACRWCQGSDRRLGAPWGDLAGKVGVSVASGINVSWI